MIVLARVLALDLLLIKTHCHLTKLHFAEVDLSAYVQFAKLIFRPQKVKYNSLNMMYISQKFCRSDTFSSPLLVFSTQDRNNYCLVINLWASLNKVKLHKYINILHLKLMYFTASILDTLQLNMYIMKVILCHLHKHKFC